MNLSWFWPLFIDPNEHNKLHSPTDTVFPEPNFVQNTFLSPNQYPIFIFIFIKGPPMSPGSRASSAGDGTGDHARHGPH